eukprot:g3878.t1
MPDSVFERFHVVRVLGEGHFSTVYLAFDNQKSIHVAIKTTTRSAKIAKHTEREVLNMRTLRHPHVIRFHEAFLTEDRLCIVLEYADGGDLQKYLDEVKTLNEDMARYYFQQIILGLDYCHKRGTCIRDLKLQNLLLNVSKTILKICDFNLSKHMSKSLPYSCVGTPEYVAPEVLLAANKQHYDGSKADVWSAGICLYRILYGFLPFTDPDPDEYTRAKGILRKVVNEEDAKIPEVQILSADGSVNVRPISIDCQELLHCLLQKNPAKRFSIADVKRHPWFLKNLPEGVLDMNAGVK